jgi:hypothetical protein
MIDRPYSEELVNQCRNGNLNPIDVLENLLFNYMSCDDAEDFVTSEYNIELHAGVDYP